MNNIIPVRMLAQQLAAPQFRTPAEVVSHFGAMQAQEYRMMRHAVSMRTRRPSLSAFERDFNEGRIIRLHLLRGTWQLVAAEDYRWMLQLCSERARRVIAGWMHASGIDIPREELEAVRSILVEVTGRVESATKGDYAAVLDGMDDHRLSYHIRMAELDGVLCSGRLHPSKATYSLSTMKVPCDGANVFNREESLAVLARKYFRSHSPATFEDYVWWSGLTAAECRMGMDMIGGELSSSYLRGSAGKREFFTHTSCRTRGFRKGGDILLAPYDEYLIGYKSRDIVLNPEFRHLAHNNSGIFYPVYAVDGIISGNWKTLPSGEVKRTPFEGR